MYWEERAASDKPGNREAVLSTVAPPLHSMTKEGKMKPIEEMTIEELRTALADEMSANTDRLNDKDLEIQSLQEELSKLKEVSQKREQELAETKKLNFTLARRVDQSPPESVESLINQLF